MRFATNQWHSCHFSDGFSVLFELNHIGQLEEVIVGPDIEFPLVNDERLHILPDHIDVGSRKAFTQLLKEKILGQIQSVELAGAELQMIEVERNSVADIPLEVVPVASLDAVLPCPEYQGVHLACIQTGKGKAACLEGEGQHQQLLFSRKAEWGIGVNLNLDLQGLLGLKG